MMGMMQGDERIEGRLAFLKAELKITDAQEKVWSDFAGALRQAAAKMQQAHMGMRAMSGMAGTVTPPQLLEHHESNLAARLEATRTVKTALGPLYAALDEQQKQTLAQLHPLFHGMM
jgi:LTXXQ motif family protein